MGDSDQGGARPAAGPSFRSLRPSREWGSGPPYVFRHDYAHIYPDPWGVGFTWETVSGGLGDREQITHFRLNAPPRPSFPISDLPLNFKYATPVQKMVKLTSMALKLYLKSPIPLEGPIAIVPPNVASAIARQVSGVNLCQKARTTTAPPPPPPPPPQVSSSSSAPAEKPILPPKLLVTPSSAPEGAQRPPISTAPPALMADASTDAPAPARSSLKEKTIQKPSRKAPFLLSRDLSPPPAASSRPARPRVLIPRLRKAGPKLDPKLKAELALIAEREKGFPADIVIAFVEELEKARQYARFNKYIREDCQIKHDSIPDDISYQLTKDNERTNKFNLVDEFDIRTLVHVYVRELIQKHYYGKEAEKPVLGSIRNPVYYLEFRAREEGYVLDQKPEAELKKLKKFAPMFYWNHFVRGKPPAVVEARTLTVSNIAFGVPERKIREYFRSYGRITCVEIESMPGCQIAHITYKDLGGAKCALSFMGANRPLISMENAPLLVLPNFARGASGAESLAVKSEDVSSMHAKALQKYSELRTEYSQYKSKHVEAGEKEGYGRCGWLDWMAHEAFTNGGYTVGGQKLRRRPKAP